MASPYRTCQDAIRSLEARSSADPAVLAWALARIVDRSVWEVRVSRFGVCIYPVEQEAET
jgi:hypothetical protein